jgi:hypothetical protein
MNAIHTIHQQLRELGAIFDVAYYEDNVWQAAMEGQAVFDIEYDAAFHRLAISSRIGALPGASASHLRAALERYNIGWWETGGVRMALDENRREVVLMFEMASSELHATTLPEVLANLAAIHAAWREFLRCDEQDEVPFLIGASAGFRCPASSPSVR